MALNRLVVGADLVDMFHGSRADHQGHYPQKAENQAEKCIYVHMPALRIQMGSKMKIRRSQNGRRQKFFGNA